jgi:4-alpha-glucanotransferase
MALEKKQAKKSDTKRTKTVEKINKKTATDLIKNQSENKKTASPKKTTQKSGEATIANKKVAVKTPTTKKQVKTIVENKEIKILNTASKEVSITFNLKFSTSYGQQLFILGNHELLGNGDVNKALPMQYANHETWSANLKFPSNNLPKENIVYNYVLKNLDGSVQYDSGNDKYFNPSQLSVLHLQINDGWNYTGYTENAFYTQAFSNVLLKNNHTKVKASNSKNATHIFQTKCPILPKGFTLCLLGNCKSLNSWDINKPILMSREEGEHHFKVEVDLTNENFAIAYKYGVYDVENKKFVKFEEGDNRWLFDTIKPQKLTIVNDTFANLPSNNWRGAGIAIPVFSIKTNESFGIGEFSDIKKLADWSKNIGLKLIQILPINDTTAKLSWEDCYPYAAISAFALHPIYINLAAVVNKKTKTKLDKLKAEQLRLNSLDSVDYDAVIKLKWNFLKEIYPLQKEETFAEKGFESYFNANKHWLVPYAVFCYLRDEYGTPNFNNWPAYKTFKQADIDALTSPLSEAYHDIAFHYFIQYHLHKQLLDATNYCHEKGIVLKGDIAIGIFRYGADAWQNAELYNMNLQAGAPPDAFAVKGQNWGFPTYNWKRMQEDGFAWWKQRFAQMSDYFDAFRIDHILGFFRIWSIPTHAVEGIMGYFVPAIPIHINEIFSKNIDYNYHRFTKPYITNSILWEFFGNEDNYVKENFVQPDGYGNYNLRQGFTTQKEVEAYFENQETNERNQKLKIGLYNLISNVLLFEVEGSQGQQFHPRFNLEQTTSFRNLDYNSQQQLKSLYIDYFFKRQDNFWAKEALQKLPALRRTTNMLICGEDLGLVPACVPDIMKQLGMLSLEIQRMPKDNKVEFFHPNDAPYLSVVTPSTHDMSVIRGWWEEDRNQTQRFYNHTMGQWGEAPFYCEGWINKAIVLQHLYSPAMWSIFQFQDLIGMDDQLRRENPADERINEPSNPKHYWRYRMNLSVEELIEKESFNTLLKDTLHSCGRD